MPRTWEIKHNIPTQILLEACWAPASIHVSQSSFAHLFMPWPLHASAGLWAALGVPSTHQGPDSPLLYLPSVCDQTPSLRPAQQLSAVKTLAVQGGKDRRIRDASINLETRWCLLPLSCLVPSWGAPQSTGKKTKGLGSWCAGISQLFNIFGCCAVHHHQSSGRSRPMASGRLPQTHCPGAYPGTCNSHLGQELAASWSGVLLFCKKINQNHKICNLTVGSFISPPCLGPINHTTNSLTLSQFYPHPK